MADKLQVKTSFTYGSQNIPCTQIITVGATDATDNQLKTFTAKIGSFVSNYTLVSNEKIETTSLDD